MSRITVRPAALAGLAAVLLLMYGSVGVLLARDDSSSRRRMPQANIAAASTQPSFLAAADLGKLSKRTCKGTTYYYYIPKSAARRKGHPLRVLVLVHGRKLIPDTYAKRWLEGAESKRFAIIAPLFDTKNFPNFNRLNIKGQRADLRLLDILEDAKSLWPLATEKLFIYGHSAGAQFTHRFALVHPDRIAKGVASCAGNYTFPDPSIPYHYGTGPLPGTKKIKLDVDAFVQLKFAVIVGALDTDATTAGGTNRQGANRVKRARNFYRAMKDYAKAHELPCKLKFTAIPRVGHSSKQTTPWAKRYLFGIVSPKKAKGVKRR